MDGPAARAVYLTAIILIVFIVLAASILDVRLIIEGEESISCWLTRNMGWFWWPSTATIIFLAGLAIHLLALRE